MRWQDKITFVERTHLRKCGITTLKQAEINAEFQKDLRNTYKKPGAFYEPCWDCRTINKKLGFDI